MKPMVRVVKEISQILILSNLSVKLRVPFDADSTETGIVLASGVKSD